MLSRTGGNRAAPRRSRARRGADILLSAAFLAVLALPSLDEAFKTDRSFPFFENRVLASRPVFRLEPEALAGYTAKVQSFHDDHFGYRNQLVRWHFKVRRFLVGATIPLVYHGKDGWQFLADAYALTDYKVTSPLTEESLAMWRGQIEQLQRTLSARGSRLLIVFVPGKHNVYSEFLPDYVYRLREKTRLDQLVEMIERENLADFVDLREPMLKARRERQSYYRYDSHWNTFGAWAAHREIVGFLRRYYPAIRYPAREQFTFAPTPAVPNNLLQIQGIDRRRTSGYRETDWAIEPVGGFRHRVVAREKWKRPLAEGAQFESNLIITEHPDSSLPRAVVFHDSFGAQLVPFLAEHFSRAAFKWTYKHDAELVERIDPDVVIHQILDRNVIWGYPF